MRRAVFLPVCLATLAMAGCASKLDTGKIEREIKQELTSRTGAKLVAVDCPGDVKAKKGTTFRCTATSAAGARVPIEVTQEDGKGRVTWRVVPGG